MYERMRLWDCVNAFAQSQLLYLRVNAMIMLYSGTPGSGKSLQCAYKLIEWIKLGRNVIANFDIEQSYFDKLRKKKKRLGKFEYVDNNDLTVEYLLKWAVENHVPRKEKQTLVIIDECASMFNSRAWDRKDRMEWIDFFRLHRKVGFEVILVAQSDRLIDRQIRAFIEIEQKHRAMKNYKTFGWILSFLCGGLFQYSQFWYGDHLRIDGNMFLLNRKKAAIYDTFKVFDMKTFRKEIVTNGQSNASDQLAAVVQDVQKGGKIDSHSAVVSGLGGGV